MRVRFTFAFGAVSLGLAMTTIGQNAFADDATPTGTMKTTQASSGTTDVATTGFEAAPKKDDTKDATDAKISAGGLLTGGNSRSLALTSAANFRMRRDSEQFSAAAAANYAQAGKVGTPINESVENVQGKLRYDHFFVGSFAGFLGASARHDRFQGLNLRLNLDPGVAYYFIDEKQQQLWGELGYDFQYDVRRQDAVDAAAASGAPIPKTLAQHGGRAFVGYANNVNESVKFNTDLEYVQSVEHSERYRLNWDAGIAASVSSAFSIGTTLLVQYDNAPLPNVQSTDVTMSVSLIYKLL